MSLREVLLTLPSNPLQDALQSGACTLCVLRFFSVRDRIYSSSVPDPSQLLHELGAAEVGDKSDAQSEETCIACLGILQETNVSATLLSAKQSVAEFEFENFSLEISVPAVILLRDRAVWCSLKSKHEEVFKAENPADEIVSVKDAFKWVIIPRLEEKLEKKFDSNSGFRISLVYRHPSLSSEVQELQAAFGTDAKRRRGTNGSSNAAEDRESISSVQRTLVSISSEAFSRSFPCPPPKVNVSCGVRSFGTREAVCVGGRYLKYSRKISQSPWLVEDERIGEGSVQEIIGNIVFPAFKGDSYKFHAAGREDIDVRMLGSGRPFILEIMNARILPTDEDLIKLQALVNSSKHVQVRNLRRTGNEVWALMREGEADKQKEYMAVVWLSRPVSEADFVTLSALKDLEIQQKTPVRVLHRRSPLTRPRTIHWMRCERLHDSQQYFVLHLCTQAGTYIKEFVHGDLGRTHPSLGSLLGCAAEILCLDVTNVKMDFLDE